MISMRIEVNLFVGLILDVKFGDSPIFDRIRFNFPKMFREFF